MLTHLYFRQKNCDELTTLTIFSGVWVCAAFRYYWHFLCGHIKGVACNKKLWIKSEKLCITISLNIKKKTAFRSWEN